MDKGDDMRELAFVFSVSLLAGAVLYVIVRIIIHVHDRSQSKKDNK
jgi:hypothetical protein